MRLDVGQSCAVLVEWTSGWTVVSFRFGGVWTGLRTTVVGRRRGKEGWHAGSLVRAGTSSGFSPGSLPMSAVEAVRLLRGEVRDHAVDSCLLSFLREAGTDAFSDVIEVMSA